MKPIILQPRPPKWEPGMRVYHMPGMNWGVVQAVRPGARYASEILETLDEDGRTRTNYSNEFAWLPEDKEQPQ